MIAVVVAGGISVAGAVPASALTMACPGILAEVRQLPGVTRVFSPSSGLSRWFDGPVTVFRVDGLSVRACVTIGVDRRDPAGGTVGLVGAYLRARLLECGFDLIEVRVRVGLLR